jgi:hypothetical protein
MKKSTIMRIARNVARIREKTNAYRIFMEKPGGKRTLGRPRRKWKDNIKLDLR